MRLRRVKIQAPSHIALRIANNAFSFNAMNERRGINPIGAFVDFEK
jgi:hypothetical protein